LWRSEPVAALALAICVFGLMGFPPTAGFAGKLFVFSGAFSPAVGDPHRTALLVLAVVAVINAAIGAVYYLRIVAACYLGEDREPLDYVPAGSLRFAVTFCAMISLCFGLWPRDLMTRSKAAASELATRVEPMPLEPDQLAAAEPALAESEAAGQNPTPIKKR
jgi:NADH-quinone oxidoreductase subunit N